MCEMCDKNGGEMESCQDCGAGLCYDIESQDDVFSPPYVTASGDLFCVRCGRGYDEREEAMDDDLDFGWEYPAAWYDPDSDLDQLEDTPQTKYIGPGSE